MCYVESTTLLIQKNADVNAGKDGGTPLYLAASHGHLDIVRILVDRFANVDAANGTGATPLYIAAQKGHLEG